jgi:hypothetical protein
MFDLVTDPENLILYKSFTKEKEEKEKKGKYFTLDWLRSKKEEKLEEPEMATKKPEKSEIFENKCNKIVKMNQFDDVDHLKKYEITR